MSSGDGLASDEQLARDLRRAVVGIHRIRWILTGVMAAIVILAVTAGAVVLAGEQRQLVSGRQQVKLERQRIAADEGRLRASCAFYRDLGTVPITIVPPTKRPSELGVAVVVHAREAYAGQGCGTLAPAPAALRRWAAYYHLAS